MLPQALTIAALIAVGAAALPAIVDAARRKTPKTHIVSDKLPFRRFDGSRLENVDGSLTDIYELGSSDPALLSTSESESLFAAFVSWLSQSGDFGVEYTFITSKSPIVLPEGGAADGIAGEFIENARASVAENAFRLEHFLLVNTRHKGKKGAESLAAAGQSVQAYLGAYRPRLLGEAPGEVWRPFIPLLNPNTGHFPADPEVDLADSLAIEDIRLQRDDGLLRWRAGEATTFGTGLVLKSSSALPNQDFALSLLRVPARLVLVHRVRPMSLATAQAAVSLRAMFALKKVTTAGDGKVASEEVRSKYEGDELTQATERLRPGSEMFTGMCVHSSTIWTLGSTAAEALTARDKIEALAKPKNMIYVRPTLVLRPAFLASFPPNVSMTRERKKFADAIACQVVLPRPPRDAVPGIFGPNPLSYFTTANGALFGFQPNTDADTKPPLSHMLAIGRPGSGKTIFLLRMVFEVLAASPETQVFYLDADMAVYAIAAAMGAPYLRLENVANAEAAFNPFLWQDSPENRAFLQWYLSVMVAGNDIVDEISSQEIADAISLNYHPTTPRELRHLRALRDAAFLPSASRVGHGKLAKYVDPANFGNLFASTEDRLLANSGRFTVFDCTFVKNMPGHSAELALGVLIESIMQRISDASRPTLIVLDEGGTNLRIGPLTRWIQPLYERARKLRAAILTGLQNPLQIAESGIGETIIHNTPTIVVFPNDAASPSDYESLGFNDTETAIATGAASHGMRRPMLVKQTGMSTLVESQMNLGRLRPLFDGTQAGKTMQGLKQIHPGASPERLVELFFERDRK